MSNTHATDEKLIKAIGRNDYVSYNQLFERYYAYLCQYAYSLLMDKTMRKMLCRNYFLLCGRTGNGLK
ncbi:MAG: hypothetical protein LUH63_04085 [Parabacteroides sp.]|nr:hypothetical protein [Parabacteroides sp.]